MQVKKDEMKHALLKSGEKEFLEKGYEKASIRKIVKQAGTTIGNFYNYFANKEALFDELVYEEYHQFIHFIQHHNDVERPDYLWHEFNPTLWRAVLSELMDEMIPHFGTGMVLILDSSKGTKYEGSKEKVIKIIQDHFIEHLEKLDNKDIPLGFAEVIAIQMAEGIITILKKYSDPEIRREYLMHYVLFYAVGTMGLIGGL